MNNILVFDGRQAGFSGDIFVSMVTDLLGNHDEVNKLIERIQNFFNLENNEIFVQKTRKHGFSGSDLVQKINFDFEKHFHGDKLLDITDKCAKNLDLKVEAIELAKKIMITILRAEGAVHGAMKEDMSDVHFHELNSIDTFIDILIAAFLISHPEIKDCEIIGLPVRTGTGMITFSHGTVQLPAPAVLEILKNNKYPFFEGNIEGEFLTPTGAAILVNIISKVENNLPSIILEKTGIGFGQRIYEKYPNYSRVLLGKNSINISSEQLQVLETHVDDVSGEILGSLFEILFNEGALDVAIFPIIMKKNRPGHCVRVLCKLDNVRNLMHFLIRNLGTLGVRQYSTERHFIPRKVETKILTIDGINHNIRIKISHINDQKIVKAEFDDVKEIAKRTGKTIREIQTLTETLKEVPFP